MFDNHIIDSLPEHERDGVVAAFSLLAKSPIFELQKQALLAQLAEGSDSEDEMILASRILGYRRRSHMLAELQYVCEQHSKDTQR